MKNISKETMRALCFKPCFKWLLPKIVQDLYFDEHLADGFKPCFKWLLPKIQQ